MQHIFFRVLSCPTILVKYGDTANENQDYKLYNPDITDYKEIIIQGANHFVVPVDPKRRDIVGILV